MKSKDLLGTWLGLVIRRQSTFILSFAFATTALLWTTLVTANSSGFNGIVATAWCESDVQDLKALVDRLRMKPNDGGFGLKRLGSTKTFECPQDVIQSVRTRSGEKLPAGASCIEFYISLKDLKNFSKQINKREAFEYEIDNVGEAFYAIEAESEFRCRFKLSLDQAEIGL